MREGASEQTPLEIREYVQKYCLKMYISTKLLV